MANYDWYGLLDSIKHFLEAVTPFLLIAYGWYQRQVNNAQNKDLSELKHNTNGLAMNLAEASEAKGQKHILEIVAKVAPAAAHAVAVEVAKQTDAKAVLATTPPHGVSL